MKRTLALVSLLAGTLVGCARPMTLPVETGIAVSASRSSAPSVQAPLAQGAIATPAAATSATPDLLAQSRQRLESWGAYHGVIQGYARFGSHAIGIKLDVTGNEDGALRATVLDTNLQNGTGLQFQYMGGNQLQVKSPSFLGGLFWQTVNIDDPSWKDWAPIIEQADWPMLLAHLQASGKAFKPVGPRTVGSNPATCLESTSANGTELVGFTPDQQVPSVSQLTDASGVVYQLVYEGFGATTW